LGAEPLSKLHIAALTAERVNSAEHVEITWEHIFLAVNIFRGEP